MRLHLALTIAALALLPQTSQGAEPKPWTLLFNGTDLTGWETYLGPAYDPVKKDFAGAPLDLNHDPNRVFSVVEIDGQKAIRVSGAAFGGLSTVKEYADYELQLEVKWGTTKAAPRTEAKRDSGILYHAVGPHGADWFFWMRSLEFQVQEGDFGDYWGCGGAIVDATATKKAAGDFVFTPGAPLLTFSQASPNGRHVVKGPRTLPEKPHGERNALTLYALGDTNVHVFNSVATMVLDDPRQPVDGKEVPLRQGKIQLQSEGAEVYYRNIRLRPITELPKGLLPSRAKAAKAGRQLCDEPSDAEGPRALASR
jgi:Domain of Unknown Function (DUF1080)